jgi:uncharacterized protein
MLSFDIRTIESQAQPVDGVLDAHDAIWETDDTRPSGAIHVTGRLSAAGHGRYYFTGHLSGEAVVACRRCLVDVAAGVEDDMTALFAEPGLDESEEDDVFPVATASLTVDLRPAVREAWLLAVPGFVVCREECRGLCPSCGVDRNEVACTCAAERADPRWDSLRSTRSSVS